MKVPTPWGEDGPGRGSPERPIAGSLARFQAALLEWHRPRSRRLRIRQSRDPWAILVAEVMAQQTQIGRVDAAWSAWMARYPTSAALAHASTADVLRAWSGLGYNRRAVSLQRAAVAIERVHGGRVPSDLDALLALPGVGPYTARAVAAVAFGQPVAAVDTNVRRVVSRVVGEVLSPAQLQAAADRLVPEDDPAAWTHATMDLGATVCGPRRPSCETCPIRRWCASAGRVEPVTRAGRATQLVPFEHTSRWLRGRIVAWLRDEDRDAWAEPPASIGTHGSAAIAAAMEGLLRDGLIEQGPDGSVRLPSGRP